MNKVGNHATFHKKSIDFFIDIVIKKLLAPSNQEVDPKPGANAIKNFEKF
jgi:hypothetical protein